MHDTELIEERLRPVAERIAQIPGETLAPEKYRDYFAGCASFLTEVLPGVPIILMITWRNADLR